MRGIGCSQRTSLSTVDHNQRSQDLLTFNPLFPSRLSCLIWEKSMKKIERRVIQWLTSSSRLFLSSLLLSFIEFPWLSSSSCEEEWELLQIQGRTRRNHRDASSSRSLQSSVYPSLFCSFSSSFSCVTCHHLDLSLTFPVLSTSDDIVYSNIQLNMCVQRECEGRETEKRRDCPLRVDNDKIREGETSTTITKRRRMDMSYFLHSSIASLWALITQDKRMRIWRLREMKRGSLSK